VSDSAPAYRLVDESLFVPDAAQVTLRGGECAGCGTTTFPHQRSCPRCGSVRMAAVALPRSGRLWSFTVQNFEPKVPYRGGGAFEPYGVGYVDLGPVIVEARLAESDAGSLEIGAAMDLMLIPAFQDEDGTRVLTYGFATVEVPS
jgi:uncharacterized OB-fold protein